MSAGDDEEEEDYLGEAERRHEQNRAYHDSAEGSDNAEDFDRLVAEAVRKNQRTAATAKGDRPTIKISVGDTERVVNEIEAALIASDRGLYRRGSLIVSAGCNRIQTWDGNTVEAQTIEERGNYALLEDIEAAADFERFDVKTKKPKRASPSITLALTLKQRGLRLRLPNLVALISCPTIKPNGDLMAEPGFDPASGILFDSGRTDFPLVPDEPTRAMADAALARLSRLTETFDFVGDDDRAVALSLILTAIARPGMDTAPLHAFDAPVAGAGKSKLVDIASILATGHEASVMAQGEDREEGEKRLSALLLRGDPLIAIDNCERPLEGVVLNQSLTQTSVELRILGFSKSVTTRCASTIAATGNNLIVKGDLTRRSLVGRLDPRVARPELRQYGYDPIADAKANRGHLVMAALTILRAYRVAGRPDPPLQIGSFEQWSDNVRGALLWLGEGDPVRTMDRLRKRDPVRASLTAILLAWRSAFGSEPTTVRKAIEAAEGGKNDLSDAFMAVAGRAGKIDSRMLGNWLSRHAADVVVDLSDNLLPDPITLEMCGERQHVGVWRLVSRKD
jgi:hypothetical protein